jgi:hypothetical protein
MKPILMLFCVSFAAQAGPGGGCTDTPIVWTIYSSYTDPQTGLAMVSNITGDGAKVDSSGNSVYTTSSGATSVAARLNNCGNSPSYDATLQITKGRAFNINVGLPLGNPYQQYPPSMFSNEAGLLNISNIMWCQNNGFPNGCTFYTRLSSAFTGPDGKNYHLRTQNPASVPVSSSSPLPDAVSNCPYTTSQIQVVFTPGSLNPSGKDTYVVTPVLQGANTGSGWTAPAPNASCPASTLPAGTWPAAVSVLVPACSQLYSTCAAPTYSYGLYDTPFKFVIQVQ